MVNYPNKKKSQSLDRGTSEIKHSKIEYGKRGMRFETEIDLTNKYYLNHQIAVIHKKPTPIQIVHVDYPKRSKAVIKEAYFQKASTTDYNGVYKGKYIDFEAKVTQNKTSFPLINIHEHQVKHMQQIKQHGGIAFLLLNFQSLNEIYMIPIQKFMHYWEKYINDEKKSIPYQAIKRDGFLVKQNYQPRIDYLQTLNQFIEHF